MGPLILKGGGHNRGMLVLGGAKAFCVFCLPDLFRLIYIFSFNTNKLILLWLFNVNVILWKNHGSVVVSRTQDVSGSE